jgi:uncharacterized protein (TIGR03435 family)
MMRYVATTPIVLLLAVQLSGQSAPNQARFSVASIKPSPVNPTPMPLSALLASFPPSPDQWRAVRVNVVQLIGVAYPEYVFQSRVVGGPAWIRTAQFDLEARKDPTTSLADVAPMMAHLLAERFALRTHVEQRPIDVYLLKMAHADGRFGPQLKRSTQTCIEGRAAQPPLRECRGTPVNGLNFPVRQVADFVQLLAFRGIDRPVLDRTGLTGYLDFHMTYDSGPFSGPGGRVNDANGLSFFTALQEQLGLKLEPAREVMSVLVVDAVERPTPN